MKKAFQKATRKIEQLNHFSCDKCGKWWTIGDAPKAKISWFCPWCGSEVKYKK